MENNRLVFRHNGQEIYEWDQTLEEVNIYFKPPKYALPNYLNENKALYGDNFVTAKFDISIKPDHLTIGIRGQKPFTNVR